MSNKKTQILYTPDTRAIHELGANWHSIVNDIDEYLENEGFEYKRAMGYLRDGESTDEEMQKIMEKIVDIGLGPEYFVAVHSYILEDIVDIGEIWHRAAEMEKNGETPDLKAMLEEAFGTDEEE